MVNSYYGIYQAERGKTMAGIRPVDAQLGGLAAEVMAPVQWRDASVGGAGHYGAEPGPAVYGGSGTVLRRVSAGRGAGEGDVPGMPGQAGLPGRRAGAQGALGRLGRRVADERRDRAA